MRVRRDDEVLAVACRLEVGDGGAPATAIADGRLIIANAFLGGAIEVPIARHAGLYGGLHDGVDDRALEAAIADIEGAAGTVKGVGAALVVLGLLEVRENAGVVPSLAAALPPAIVVGRGAAHVDHAVQRAGAAEHFAARLVGRPPIQAGDRLALEFPVVDVVGVELVVADGDVDPGVVVAAAGFQEEHAVAAGFRETRGHRATRRSRARDDIIESFPVHLASHGCPRFAYDWIKLRAQRPGSKPERHVRIFLGSHRIGARWSKRLSLRPDDGLQFAPHDLARRRQGECGHDLDAVGNLVA